MKEPSIVLSDIKGFIHFSCVSHSEQHLIINEENAFHIQSFLQTISEGHSPYLPFHRYLWCPSFKKIKPFLPFSKKKLEKGCLFTIFTYILNMSYTFKFKRKRNQMEIKNVPLRISKVPFSCTLPFFEPGGNSAYDAYSTDFMIRSHRAFLSNFS